MQVLEQEDGFRISSDRFFYLKYLKKADGWTKKQVEEFCELTSDLWNVAYNLGVTSVGVEKNLSEMVGTRGNKI
jgi:hypothetical protein